MNIPMNTNLQPQPFQAVPSAQLFSDYSPMQRKEYFSKMASTDGFDMDMNAVYGHSDWSVLQASSENPELAAIEAWNNMSYGERYDTAYGRAITRALSPIYESQAYDAFLQDQNQLGKTLSNGVGDTSMDAYYGEGDPERASMALYKYLFGG